MRHAVRIHIALFFVTLGLAGILLWSAACSGRSTTGDPMLDELLSVPEDDIVTFSLAGTAACRRCLEDEIPIAALMIEVAPVGDSTSTLAMEAFEGLGPFSFSGLRYGKGMELEVRGTLYTEGSPDEASAMRSSVVVDVPDSEGATAAFIINFPASTD